MPQQRDQETTTHASSPATWYSLSGELRQTIFELVLFEYPGRQLFLSSHHIPQRGSCQPPALLHVNREARAVALQLYRLVILPIKGSLVAEKYVAELEEEERVTGVIGSQLPPGSDLVLNEKRGGTGGSEQQQQSGSTGIEATADRDERYRQHKRGIFMAHDGRDQICIEHSTMEREWARAVDVNESEAWERPDNWMENIDVPPSMNNKERGKYTGRVIEIEWSLETLFFDVPWIEMTKPAQIRMGWGARRSSF